ncbi:MAG: CopG family transcriptional regulator [Gammaproteobacteria bacterium]|nr:CopG family transcriptional regulator [Gammaproteobacteria bacterium]|tara:strand:+ start:9357 stop:9821 length:465 start_codon:yes stop_codon:yes gene_type:complete
MMKLVLIGTAVSAAVVAGVVLSAPAPAAPEDTITVHKTPWCGCCGDWVDHLRVEGFDVTVQEHDDLAPVRTRLGVPLALSSCHTAKVDGYVIEGHVPATDIRRLLLERPKGVRGLAVPGMPVGSPGMEMGDRKDPFDVVAFGDDGTQVFQSHHR